MSEVRAAPRPLAIGVVIATAAIFGLTYGLVSPLISLNLVKRGLGEGAIGLNAAMYALGVLLVAVFLPRLAARFGLRSLSLTALAAAAVVLALFPAAPWIWLWFPLRFCLGLASELLFVSSEAWLNGMATEESRGRTMAAYTATLSLGYAVGPMVLSVVGTDGATAYLIGAGITLTAFAVMALSRVHAPRFDEPPTVRPLAYLKLAPVGIAATALNAAIETAGLSFFAIYAMHSGWNEPGAARLLSTLLVGAVLLQLPIGWLADRVDRRRLLVSLALLAAGGALVWPLILPDPYLAYPAIFLWGGVFVGVYTIALAHVGGRFSGGDLVGIYAVMSLAWGLGALLGPATAGLAMEATPQGLPLFAAAACFGFAVLAWRLRKGA
ncbi:MAG: MFS transporter [Phenylobacterium sp.]|uniref:MFS transporter n=1 Tax=Phenylobacterium sp. TaxID=1871053 RepID=UPI0025E548B6|nr:MFS transporter [Phenylobacterium sp.]MBA4011986.1 MFS transporter [Phenylobacterium sp.]